MVIRKNTIEKITEKYKQLVEKKEKELLELEKRYKVKGSTRPESET